MPIDASRFEGVTRDNNPSGHQESSKLLVNDELISMTPPEQRTKAASLKGLRKEQERNESLAGPTTNPTGLWDRKTGKPVTPSARDNKATENQISETPRAVRIERTGTEPYVLPLYPDKALTLGRGPECSVVFPSDATSRLHAQLRFVDDHWLFRDLNSRNGSLLSTGDSVRTVGATKEHRVRVGDEIILGNRDSRLTFLSMIPDDVTRAAEPAKSAAAKKLERQIEICAKHRLPVFLLGASGVGKTFVARQIHELSKLPGQFVLLNCGRLPHDPAQLTSELLGHVKGAFTGAGNDRVGRLWSADGGTLFLDEVESLPPIAQDFFLDVLEGSGNFLPYGAPIDARRAPPKVRVLSASKVPLTRSKLRPDLCQRLAAGDVIALPSLADRTAEIPGLVDTFLGHLRDEQRIDARVSPEGLRFLQKQTWLGEIRELESTIKVVVSRAWATFELDGKSPAAIEIGISELRSYLEDRKIGFGEIDESPSARTRKRPSDLSREEIERVLTEHGGNKTRAAESLGIAVNTLKSRLQDS